MRTYYMTTTINSLLDAILKTEGGYVNNPNDRGGETNWGVTIAVARENGYAGPMREMSRQQATEIYRNIYFFKPKFDRVMTLSAPIAAELFDTGVNMGVGTASKFLQRSLNVLNRRQKDYTDIAADGVIGNATLNALAAYLKRRGDVGETRILRALNALQGARYIELCEKREANEEFMFGWLDRVAL